MSRAQLICLHSPDFPIYGWCCKQWDRFSPIKNQSEKSLTNMATSQSNLGDSSVEISSPQCQVDKKIKQHKTYVIFSMTPPLWTEKIMLRQPSYPQCLCFRSLKISGHSALPFLSINFSSIHSCSVMLTFSVYSSIS